MLGCSPYVRVKARSFDLKSPPRSAGVVGLDRGWFANAEGKAVAVRIRGHAVDDLVTNRGAVQCLGTDHEIDIASRPGSILQPHLQGHAALQDPPFGLAVLEAEDEALEGDAAPESLQACA